MANLLIIIRIEPIFTHMTEQIEIVRKTRSFLLENLKELTAEQYNKTPDGFNNNIIWNLGHMLYGMQGICYTRAGLSPFIDEKYIALYKSGTKPGEFVDETEIENIKQLLFTSLDQLKADYHNNIFGNYTTWTTRYGVALASIDDALNFLPFHEGLHSGCINALKRLVA